MDIRLFQPFEFLLCHLPDLMDVGVLHAALAELPLFLAQGPPLLIPIGYTGYTRRALTSSTKKDAALDYYASAILDVDTAQLRTRMDPSWSTLEYGQL